MFVVVLALALRRYGDRIAATVPDRLRSGGSETTDDDEAGDAAGTATDDGAWSPETPQQEGGAASDDDEGGVAVAPDDDVGALVALAFLALVAALVRKATEDPPRDPLVDGPD